jgi:WD40 repeat protein
LETVPELEAAAVSDDGQLLVVGDYHGGLTILRSPLGDGSTSTSAHESTWGRIDDIEFLAGTHIVAVASADGQTHLFDVDTQRELRALNTHSFTFGCLARAANGAFLVVGGGDAAVTRLTLAGLTNPAILWQDKPVRDVEFLSDGRLAVACENGELHVRDLATANSEHWNSGDEHPTARTISVQPGGTLVAAAGNQPVVELWDAAAGKVVRTLPVSKAGATVVQFSHLGRQLAVAHRADPEAPAGVVQIYRTDELRKQPDDMRAAVPAQSILPAGEGQANALAFSPDDRRLVAAWSDGRIDLVDPAGGPAREPSLTIKTAPWSLAFCDGGKTLAIGTNTGEIHLWDLAAGEGRVRTVIKGHTGRINAMAALPGGQTLVSGGRDRRLKLWDVATGELITSLTGHRKQVFTIRVSPDGGIVSGGLEGDVRMWTGFAKK